MFKQIRNKILLLNMVMVSTVIIVAFAVIFTTTYTRTVNDNWEKLRSGNTTQLILSGRGAGHGQLQPAEPVPDRAIVSNFATRISPNTGLSFSLLVDLQANLADINSMVDLQPETYTKAAKHAITSIDGTGMITLEGRRWQYIVSPVTVFFTEMNGNTASSVTIQDEFSHIRFLDVTNSYRMIQSLALMLGGLSIVVLAVIFFISRYFANRAIRPMEEAWEKQGRFIADASHELKTPLSVINANCGVLYAGKEDTVESQIRWVDSIMRAADRMTGLVSSLLSLASMEDTQLELHNTRIDLSDMVYSAATEMDATAFEKGVGIHREIEPDIMIESDKEHINKLFSILLDNAVKYTDSGGIVTVTLMQEKRRIVCAVRNTGEGIPPEDLPRLFDRFYRRDPSRSSENSGYGLGLAIAQAVAKQLGVELSAHSIQEEYTEFRVVFEHIY